MLPGRKIYFAAAALLHDRPIRLPTGLPGVLGTQPANQRWVGYLPRFSLGRPRVTHAQRCLHVIELFRNPALFASYSFCSFDFLLFQVCNLFISFRIPLCYL
jgi:hypothetical protein